MNSPDWVKRPKLGLSITDTIAQIEATQAQKTASEAEEKGCQSNRGTALHTERSANYQAWQERCPIYLALTKALPVATSLDVKRP